MKNLSLLTDFYQLSMMKGYLESGVHEDPVVFDLFFRKNPFHNSYTIVAGVESLIEYINHLHFS